MLSVTFSLNTTLLVKWCGEITRPSQSRVRAWHTAAKIFERRAEFSRENAVAIVYQGELLYFCHSTGSREKTPVPFKEAGKGSERTERRATEFWESATEGR
eukprot:s3021_g3.t1